jgi:hypothetical protein
MTAVCDIAPCSLVEVDRRFRGAYCLQHQRNDGSRAIAALLMEATHL